MIPAINDNGALSLRMKRLVDFVMCPQMLIFLVDHNRPRDTLFQKLQSKHSIPR